MCNPILLQWMTAATVVSISSSGYQPMRRIDYNGFEISEFIRENADLCYAVSQPCGRRVLVVPLESDQKTARDIKTSEIEREAYNNREAEEIVKDIVLSFIKETGIVCIRIHVAKKLFQSNGKVMVSILVEEMP